MHRAYSILNVKNLDAEQRIITGVATTPEPDRVGDIVEPLGVQFKNPLPLLLHHDSRAPVGHVTFHKPTKEGIDFTARLAKSDEPGALKDRLDLAWQSVKAGLISGVSIGFRALEEVFMKETLSFRFIKTEVLELSLVTVPANASATIQTIKSLDLAASGTQAESKSSSAGVSALSPSPRRVAPMNLSERITTLKTERKTTADRMKTLMQPEVDGTGSMDEAQTTEYDGLTKNLQNIDRDLARFEALEQAEVMPQATPVKAHSFESGAQTRAGQREVIVRAKELPPGIEFTRAIICKVAGRMFGVSPLDVLRERYPDHPRIEAYLKAAVAGATTTDSTWAAPLVTTAQTLTSEFLEFLRPMTIVGKFGTGNIPSLTRVPFNIRVQSQTSGGTSGWVGQGVQKPVTKFDYAAVSLYWAKIAAISVLSDELIRFSTPSAEGRVRDSLTGTIVERMDIDFINPWLAAVANVSPASITNGIAAKTPTGTGDADDVRADVLQVMGSFLTANANVTNLVWIMPNSVALNLSLMRNTLGGKEFPDITVNGGMFEGFPVITSQYASTAGSPDGNLVILVDAKEIFLADDGGVTIDASKEASIEMSSDPANESGSIVSMYQTNQVALRAERYINWARARSSSVAWLQNVSWSATA